MSACTENELCEGVSLVYCVRQGRGMQEDGLQREEDEEEEEEEEEIVPQYFIARITQFALIHEKRKLFTRVQSQAITNFSPNLTTEPSSKPRAKIKKLRYFCYFSFIWDFIVCYFCYFSICSDKE